MTCKKNNSPISTDANGAVKLSAIVNELHNVKVLAKGYLEKSKNLFALDEALTLAQRLKNEIIGENQEEVASATDIDQDIHIDEVLLEEAPIQTGGFSGDSNMLIYVALAAAGIYLLSKN